MTLLLRTIQFHEDRNNNLFDSPECQQLLDMYASYYPKSGFVPPWVGYLILKNNQVVGTCGFTGEPQDNQVEIAYWTFKAFEGKGIASFACMELIAIARSVNPDMKVVAKTAPESNPSTHILEKNGFVHTEVVRDEEIGDAWLWVLT